MPNPKLAIRKYIIGSNAQAMVNATLAPCAHELSSPQRQRHSAEPSNTALVETSTHYQEENHLAYSLATCALSLLASRSKWLDTSPIFLKDFIIPDVIPLLVLFLKSRYCIIRILSQKHRCAMSKIPLHIYFGQLTQPTSLTN